MKLIAYLVGILLSVTLILFCVIVSAQTNSLTVGAFTIDASGTTAVTAKPPTRNGTLAITADIPTAPSVNVIAGQTTLVNGVVTVLFPAQVAPPICVAIDVTAASAVRRSTVTVNSVTFEGVTNHSLEYICTAKNN